MTPPDPTASETAQDRAIWVYAVTEAVTREIQHSGSLESLEKTLGTKRIHSQACDLIEMPRTDPDHLRSLLAKYYGVTDRDLRPHTATLRAHDGRVAILTEVACVGDPPTQPTQSSSVRFLIKLPVQKSHRRGSQK